MDIVTDAYIPAGYIANEFQKLDIYKRIAGIETEEEKDEMLEELIDRFGEPPNQCSACFAWQGLRRWHMPYISLR